jgi:hypothetical protein
MTSAWIAKAVDVLEESRVDLPSGLPGVVPDEFGLHRLEECFDCGVEAPIFVNLLLAGFVAHRDV